MIVVAIAALLMVPIVWLNRLSQTLENFYGTGGILERSSKGDASAWETRR